MKPGKDVNNSESLRRDVRNKEHTGTGTYTKDKLHGLEQFTSSDSSNANTHSKRQDHYDPDIKLVYRDEKGNRLTTKEAYKKTVTEISWYKKQQEKESKNEIQN